MKFGPTGFSTQALYMYGYICDSHKKFGLAGCSCHLHDHRVTIELTKLWKHCYNTYLLMKPMCRFSQQKNVKRFKINCVLSPTTCGHTNWNFYTLESVRIYVYFYLIMAWSPIQSVYLFLPNELD